MKKLLLIIPLLVGCTREYNCDIMMENLVSGEINSLSAGESYSVTNVYGVTWPKGEKEVEEQCEETWGDNMGIGTDETGQAINRFHSCSCHKVD